MEDQKIIFVSGANGLVGKKLSEFLYSQGYIVIRADITFSLDFEIGQVYLNITDKESIDNAINETVRRFGKIDCFINCSYPKNKNYGRKFFDVEYKDFSENLSIHLGGYFLCMQVFAQFFIKQGYGNIINFSSIYGVVTPSFEIYEGTNMTMPVEYAAIKSGLIHVSKYLAKILKNNSVRVNTISIGGVLDKQDISFLDAYKKKCLNKGMLDIEDILGTVKFLISDDSKFINGQNIIIDDGFTL